MINLKKEVIEWIVSIFIAIALVIILNVFVASSYTVSGLSMYPTFHDKDKVIVSKISKTFNTFHEGDVVVFHHDSKNDYVKRLIGKPGDTIEYKDDILYVNGKKVKEPYLNYNKKHKFGKYLTEDFSSNQLDGSNGRKKIPKNKYLVLGDNRQNSIDSRREEVGLVEDKRLVGKVVLRFLPLKDIRFGFNPGTFH